MKKPKAAKLAPTSQASFDAPTIAAIERLARLGPEITPAHVALKLEIPLDAFEAWRASAEGTRIWTAARAAGRIEVLEALRTLGVEKGDPAALKQYAALLEREEAPRLADLWIPAAELAALMGAPRSTIGGHVPQGDFPPVGTGNRYGLRAVLAFFPVLWAKLSELRRELGMLKAATAGDRLATEELRRQKAEQELRERKRKNDEADGRLIERSQAEEELRLLCDAVRMHVAEFVQEVCLHLALEGEKARAVDAAGKAFLKRCAKEMGEKLPVTSSQ